MSDMVVKFRIVYFKGKCELFFIIFKFFFELQKLNGVEMNKNYVNDMKCVEMIVIINEELKSEFEIILRERMYFSIFIDVGIDCLVKENEVMNVCYVFLLDGSVLIKCLGVVELEYVYVDGKKNIILKQYEL